MDLASGRWFLPTFKRPERLRQFFQAAAAVGGFSTKGTVIVNGSRRGYASVPLPDGWDMVVLPKNIGLGGALNWALKHYPAEGWYGVLVDDLWPETPGWDAKLVEAVQPMRIASCMDGFRTPNRMGTPVFGGDLLRAWGFWSVPGVWHSYMDDFWERIGSEFSIWTQLSDVMVRHKTPFGGSAAVDETHETAYGPNSERLAADKVVFDKFIEENQDAIWASMSKALGVVVRRVNVAGKSIFFGTPCHDSHVHMAYHQAMVTTTLELIRHQVAPFSHMIPGDSMVHRARNHTVGAFMESPCTHLMFIDGDMSWNPSDVLRLLSHEKDLVSGLGVRKQDPISFCGVLPPVLECCQATGCVEAHHAGTGFMLISRECIERVIAAYPETKYKHADGKVYYCLFEPVIRNEQLWSEDYEFCDRFRRIGGKVWVDPSIELSHYGNKAWTAKLLDHLKRVPAPEAVPETVPSVAAE